MYNQSRCQSALELAAALSLRVCSLRQHAHSTFPPFSFKCKGKETLHCRIMKKYSTKYCQMPDVVGASNVVEPSMQPPFWDLVAHESPSTPSDVKNTSYLTGIYDCAHEIYCDRFANWCIEHPSPCRTSSEAQLKKRGKPRRCKRHVKSNPNPVHVRPIERRMPG